MYMDNVGLYDTVPGAKGITGVYNNNTPLYIKLKPLMVFIHYQYTG
jgi:hypothetical protein